MIIAVQNKLFRNQIVSPFLQCLYDRIEFLVICGLLNLRFIQFLTEVCDRSIILAQDHSFCKSTRVTLDLKCLVEIWQNQNWLLNDLLLRQVETLLCFLCLVKIFVSFLHRILHRCSNPTEILDKFFVETS
jgi:hypothetical protein